jgi:hypothetical protein
MPKDPKRNIQNYQLQGGNLNEYEFQKSQNEMAEESELPFAVETDNPDISRAKRVAEVTAKVHRKVEKLTKRADAKAEGRPGKSSGKKSAKKAAIKLKSKTAKPAVTKKRASVKSRRHKLAASR